MYLLRQYLPFPSKFPTPHSKPSANVLHLMWKTKLYIDIRQHDIFRYFHVILPSKSISSRLSFTLECLDTVLCTTAVSLYDCCLFVRLPSLCTTAVSLYDCCLFVRLPSLCTTAVSLYDCRLFVRLPSLCNYSKSWIIRHKRSNKSVIRTIVAKQTGRWVVDSNREVAVMGCGQQL